MICHKVGFIWEYMPGILHMLLSILNSAVGLSKIAYIYNFFYKKQGKIKKKASMIEMKYMNKSIYKQNHENVENSFSEINTRVIISEMSKF